MTENEGENSRPRLLEPIDDQTEERIRRSLPAGEDVLIREVRGGGGRDQAAVQGGGADAADADGAEPLRALRAAAA